MNFLIAFAVVMIFMTLGEWVATATKAFIPSVFIYYNESALIHSVWYFVVSVVGTAIGTVITKLFAK